MTSQEINKKALELLDNQLWYDSQKLFFLNAKHPSYQTYNNLGVYLINEGLTLKNGRVRNALKLGLKYLQKSHRLSKSFINLCSIMKAIDIIASNTANNNKENLYRQAYAFSEEALLLRSTEALSYNSLRFNFLLDYNNPKLIKSAEKLAKEFCCPETVSLYFAILKEQNKIALGMNCINQYRDLLEKPDVLMLYNSCGLYEEGFLMCEAICEEYDIDIFIASAMIDCCLKTNHKDDAFRFSEIFREKYSNIECSPKRKGNNYPSLKAILSDPYYRNGIIKNYHMNPPFMDTCCYFGCTIHRNDW